MEHWNNVCIICKMKWLYDHLSLIQEIWLPAHACHLLSFYEFDIFLTGPVFMYSLRNMPILYVSDPDLVKEIGLCTSLDLGKPSHLQREQWPLFGHGIFRTNGPDWAKQRKIIAPSFFMDKVKVRLAIHLSLLMFIIFKC